MEEIKEFVIPSFLQGNSVDEIHKEMLGTMPDDIDKGEGGFPWDFTRPTALINAEVINFKLIEVMKNIWPQYAYEQSLDDHAVNRGLIRKPAEYATGKLTVTGTPGTKIEKGFKFSTEVDTDNPAIEFEAAYEVTIPPEGSIEFDIKAAVAGTDGNVAASTIKVQVAPIRGILSIINNAPVTGGIDQESDKDLQQRVVEYDRNQGLSFVGSNIDYKRWAMSVQGVGQAQIVEATDDTGLVTIVITDTEGNPGSSELCTKVYNYIMRPDAPPLRLAPVNSLLSVISPSTVVINVSCTVYLQEGYLMETVRLAFIETLKDFLINTTESVRYISIAALLSPLYTDGIEDVANIIVNGGTVNIPLTQGQIATAGTVTFNAP